MTRCLRNSLKSLVLLLVVAGAAAPSARADFNLATLIATDGTILVGDKLFSNFSYHLNDMNGMPPASSISVFGTADALGNLGIEFTGLFTANLGTNSDATLGYTVTVVGPRKITDVHMYANPIVFGGTGSITVTETFPSLGGTGPTLVVGAVNTGGGTTTVQADAGLIVPPVSSLDVLKDIGAISGTGTPQISSIVQTFSQTAPEPASLALLGGGLIVAVGYRLRKGRNLGAN